MDKIVEIIIKVILGQNPFIPEKKILILTCKDPRLNHLFTTEHFLLHRSLGTIIPHYKEQKHSLEFKGTLDMAIGLGVKSIFIVGHSDCRAIDTMLDTSAPKNYLKAWTYQNHTLIKDLPGLDLQLWINRVDYLAQQTVSLSAQRLREYPQIKEDGDINIYELFYDLRCQDVYPGSGDGIFMKTSYKK